MTLYLRFMDIFNIYRSLIKVFFVVISLREWFICTLTLFIIFWISCISPAIVWLYLFLLCCFVV
ncbi:hypothetical protein BCV72DRAFT_95350 [Rhizopus microsporus var. microsporus]|uniref:Uncharacterized protein n=1 Tax=Rhizopus microsporus var. microsporus TaxID=86635 RepID=A0A1X0R830_RHIZD|nr:hypothetical protein BCV72DRAFT_95350 [Rhizopus microsporus var. microsporus]